MGWKKTLRKVFSKSGLGNEVSKGRIGSVGLLVSGALGLIANYFGFELPPELGAWIAGVIG